MKGTWAYALTLAVLLTGCGAKPEVQSPVPVTDTTGIDTEEQTVGTPASTAEAVTEGSTEAETVAVPTAAVIAEDSAAETNAPAETAAPTTLDGQYPDGSWDAIVTSYRTAIEEKISAAKAINALYEVDSNDFIMTYTLYDIDHNGTPELLVKYGTCEADFRIAVYTYRSGALVKLADEIGGSHTSFGYDYKANQLVLTQGHMGYGDMFWYDLDENGDLKELIDTGGFSFGMDDQPDYDYYLKKYNVAYLPFSDTCSFDGNIKTYVYETGDYTVEPKEYSGMNYSFLENYQH